MMNPLLKLERQLHKELPRAAVKLDLPSRQNGTSFLDVRAADFQATVEWRPGHGFGLSAPPGKAYGLGPDEVFQDVQAVLARLRELLAAKKATAPQRELSLRRLREIRRMTQEELARRLDVKQATVSKLEHREELYVSTLRRVIEALGGELELVARFDDGSVILDLGGPD